MNASLAVVAPKELAQWKSPDAIKQRIVAIQQLMADVLKPGDKDNEFSGDYGIIPGTGKKPSLWKSGSEQILAMFEIAVEPIVEDLSTDDCFRYRVTTRLTHAPSGNFLGAGIGEASSDETKYKWKKTYSKKEFDSTPADRRRIKFSQYKDASGFVDKEEMQVRQEPADVANTILKMAKKRSQIDGTLTVTGASSMFDQDLEDLPEDVKRERAETKETQKRGGKKAANTDVMCADCRAVNGHLPNCKHRAPQGAAAAPQATVAAQPATGKELTKVAALILSINRLNKKANAKGIAEPYIRLQVVDSANNEASLYLWHKTPQEFFTDAVVDKHLVCEISIGKKGDGSEFRSIENVLELAGQPFADNKPVAVQGEVLPKEEDF